MADPVKRTYRAPRRAASAVATRASIREAAERLFVQGGYGPTTMRGVATAAGVGERTLYDAFPTKAALFAHTLGVAIVGDEDDVPVARRPEVRAALEQSDPTTALAHLVTYTAALLERAGDLIMVSVEAAGAERDMRATADAGARATHQLHLDFAKALHRRGALRQGLDAMSAADILFALSSPHVHQLLRRHCRWKPQKYRRWLLDTLTRDLLDPSVRAVV